VTAFQPVSSQSSQDMEVSEDCIARGSRSAIINRQCNRQSPIAIQSPIANPNLQSPIGNP
jgi:hypothetical protein